MVKKIGLVVVLLAAGVAIALYMRGGFSPDDPVDAFVPQVGAGADVRIADLERALAAQIERARTLDKRVSELEGRIGDLGRIDRHRLGAQSRIGEFETGEQGHGSGSIAPLPVEGATGRRVTPGGGGKHAIGHRSAVRSGKPPPEKEGPRSHRQTQVGL